MPHALKITAWLTEPLVGQPPHFDSLLVSRVARLRAAPPIERTSRLPEKTLPIPLKCHRVGRFLVPLVSSPIWVAQATWLEYFHSRTSFEWADWLNVDERLSISQSSGPYKTIRLPMLVQRVERIVWFAVGTGREIRKLLRHVHALGKKRSFGFGRVARWDCEVLGDPPHPLWPWWIDGDQGPVLMRPVPAECPELPAGLLGCRLDFGACCDPYWHPGRFTEILVPC